jgi:hypothetical protein
MQTEQLKNAKRVYLIYLNNPTDGARPFRYAVYTDCGNGLDVLWPNYDDDPEKLLPYQVDTKMRQYPKYHFAVSGYGSDKNYALASALAQYCAPDCEFYTLTGYRPSRIYL